MGLCASACPYIEKYFLKGFIFGLTSSFSQVRICSTILCNIRNSNPCKKCILTMTVLLYGKVNQIWLKIGNTWATTYLPSNIFYQIECPFHTSNINFWSFWLGFKSQYSWTIFKQTKKRIPKIFEISLEKYLVTFLSHLKKLQNLYSNSDLKSWNTTKQLLQSKLRYRK